MKLIINNNEAIVLSITKRGAEVQNLKTRNSDEDFYVVFCYTKPNCSLNEYPTDIQKDKVELTLDLKAQLKEQGYELNGDVVFKELRALFLHRVSTEYYDYFFVNEEFSLYKSPQWEFIDAVKPLMYDHIALLNHLWKKVDSFYKRLDKNPQDTSRYLYYTRLYQQTSTNGKYNPWIENEEWASEIRDVKLGGVPRHDLMDYKYEVEKLHLGVGFDDKSKNIWKFKDDVIKMVQGSITCGSSYTIILHIVTGLVASCKFEGCISSTSFGKLHINFSTHPEDTYEFCDFTLQDLKVALEAPSFGRHFKQEIENRFTVYKNGSLLTKR